MIGARRTTFFFQAEDGIRDYKVTGVQTCALPISLLQAVGLPTELPPLTFQQLWGAMQHDKKVSHGRLNCVLPEGIGREIGRASCRERVWQGVGAGGVRR